MNKYSNPQSWILCLALILVMSLISLMSALISSFAVADSLQRLLLAQTAARQLPALVEQAGDSLGAGLTHLTRRQLGDIQGRGSIRPDRQGGEFDSFSSPLVPPSDWRIVQVRVELSCFESDRQQLQRFPGNRVKVSEGRLSSQIARKGQGSLGTIQGSAIASGYASSLTSLRREDEEQEHRGERGEAHPLMTTPSGHCCTGPRIGSRARAPPLPHLAAFPRV